MFGILHVNKPAGWTSRDVVNRISRLVRPAKVGHAGTLDPLATGVLVVCIGPATRLVPFIHEDSKIYEGTFLLGQSSPTDDVEGELTPTPLPGHLTQSDLERLLLEFTGAIEQVPPAYSAVKIRGERAYHAARRGETVEIAPRTVVVHQIELIDCRLSSGDAEATNHPSSGPSFSLRIECGTGTYIRSLGRDLARRLGTEAVMSRLTRTSVGPFLLKDAIDVERVTLEQITAALRPPLMAVSHLPKFQVNADQARALGWGQAIDISSDSRAPLSPEQSWAIVNEQGHLLAIGQEKQGRLAPRMVFRV